MEIFIDGQWQRSQIIIPQLLNEPSHYQIQRNQGESCGEYLSKCENLSKAI
jgi:hypothetical protein